MTNETKNNAGELGVTEQRIRDTVGRAVQGTVDLRAELRKIQKREPAPAPAPAASEIANKGTVVAVDKDKVR